MNKIGLVDKRSRHETRAISSPEIRDMRAKVNLGNEIAALADGNFNDSRAQPSSEPGLVIPGGSIAKRTFVSSVLNGLVDNLIKPVEGIEPSSQRMTNPESLQAAGDLQSTMPKRATMSTGTVCPYWRLRRLRQAWRAAEVGNRAARNRAC